MNLATEPAKDEAIYVGYAIKPTLGLLVLFNLFRYLLGYLLKFGGFESIEKPRFFQLGLDSP